MKTTNETIVAFHIGRGGRFWNQGHKTFIGNKDINQFTDDLFNSFENESEFSDRECFDDTNETHSKCILDLITDEEFERLESEFGISKSDLGDEYWFTCGGYNTGLLVDNDGTGRIDIDGEYDSTYCDFLSNCTKEELQLILESNEWNNEQLIQEFFDECTDVVIDWKVFNGNFEGLIDEYFMFNHVDIEEFYETEEEAV